MISKSEIIQEKNIFLCKGEQLEAWDKISRAFFFLSCSDSHLMSGRARLRVRMAKLGIDNHKQED